MPRNSIFQVISSITTHPLNRGSKFQSVVDFFKWQVASRLMPHPIIIPFAGNNKLIVKRGLSGATGNLYSGLFEFEEMGFVLHLLKAGDLFVDVGANIGSFTVIASGEIGAHTIAFEPVPSTFGHYMENIAINNIGQRVDAYNKGVGNKAGTIKFTAGLDTTNHVATEEDKNTINVEIVTLDSILQNSNPVLLKIDVEGFESAVIGGAIETIKKQSLKAIIIELRGHGKKYGFDENSIHELLVSEGFKPCSYDPFNRTIGTLNSHGGSNTIYIRDIDFVKNRTKAAKRITIKNSSF